MRFEILPMRDESIQDILKLADEGGLSPWSEADYRAEIGREGSITLEALEKETHKPRGYIVARLITKSNTRDPYQAEILNITVHSDYRKLGLGSMLLRKAIATLASNPPGIIWLEVRCSNTGAIDFYKAHGFTCEYIRKDFYSNPVEDGLVMRLEV